MEKEKKEQLYMPYGVKNRREYFNGFGKSEMIITLVSLIASGGIAMLFQAFGLNTFLSSLLFLFIPTATAVCVTKDISNTSVINLIFYVMQFNKSKKTYDYVSRQTTRWIK